MDIYKAKQRVYRSLNRVAHTVTRVTSQRIDSTPYRPDRLQSRRGANSHLALIAGPFSYGDWCATFGDTEAMYAVAEWLEAAGIPCDIACHPSNGLAGLDITALDPAPYTIFIYVCGPWDRQRKEFLFPQFAHCAKVGVNLSVVEPENHGFDVLLPRDIGSLHSPDIVFSRPSSRLMPLAGVALVHEQPEYGERQCHQRVEQIVDSYLARNEVIPLPIDTLHVDNTTSTRSIMQLEHLLPRLDVVITTRLHGLVFSLKYGTPVVAIDPISGGGKVTAQADAVGWPFVFSGEEIDADAISLAVRECASGARAADVIGSCATAGTRVLQIKREFLRILGQIKTPS